MWKKMIGLAACAALLVGPQSARAADGQPVNDVPKMTAGYQYSIQVEEDGTVWTFGRSPGGRPQVGRQPGGALERIVQASAGYAHAAAVDADGRVWTWGSNEAGQRGQGDEEVQPVADVVPLGADERAVEAAAGYDHTLALTENGTVWAWGSNRYGQLGDGTERDRSKPVRVMNGKRPLDDVTAIAAGFGLSYALSSDGTVWTWGDMGKTDEDLQQVMRRVGGKLVPLDGIVSVAAGYDHALALDRDGKLYAWGSNRSGQLGVGYGTAYSLDAVRLAEVPSFTAIAAGERTSAAIDGEGNIWVWGAAYPADPQSRSADDRYVPEQLTKGVAFTSVTVGRDHGMAVDEDERIWVWGANGYGQLAHAYRGFSTVHPVVKKELERTRVSASLSAAAVEETKVVDGQGVIKLIVYLMDDNGRPLDDKWPTAELHLRGFDPVIEPLALTETGTYTGELSIPFPYYLMEPNIEIHVDGETLSVLTGTFE